MAKDRDIKYAEYDYGQPEGEKNGLLIRSQSGDTRVHYLIAAFVVIPLVIGAVFAIPGVREYLDGRENLSEIALGREYYGIDACVQGKRLNLAAIHEAKGLVGATAVEVTVVQQNRGKGTVATASRTIDLADIDLNDLPSRLPLDFTMSEFDVVAPNSVAYQCAYKVDIIR